MKLTVFTQNDCRFCGMTKGFLDDREVKYETINISDEPEYINKYDLMGAPTVVLFDEENEEVARTTGFNPEELGVLIDNLD